EKALFRHLKSGDRPPKYGLIYQHPQVRGAKWWNRGKIARMLAGRISLAVRRDVFTKTFDENVFEDFLEQAKRIEKENPFPTKTTKKRKEEKSKSKKKRKKSKKRNKRR
ncbi:ATP-binding protein, partial [bacterium]|nr:ATP-binding protein [bacterium]